MNILVHRDPKPRMAGITANALKLSNKVNDPNKRLTGIRSVAVSTSGLGAVTILLAMEGYTVKFMKLSPARAPAPRAIVLPVSIYIIAQKEFVCHGVKNSLDKDTKVHPMKEANVEPNSKAETVNGARV